VLDRRSSRPCPARQYLKTTQQLANYLLTHTQRAYTGSSLITCWCCLVLLCPQEMPRPEDTAHIWVLLNGQVVATDNNYCDWWVH
jgi:hypothetical protein